MIDEAKERVNKSIAEVQQIRAAKENLPKLSAEIDSLKVDMQKCLDVIPEVERNPEIAYNLKKIGDSNKIAISTLGLGEPVELSSEQSNNSANTNTSTNTNANADANKTVIDSKKIYVIPATMTASGDYDAIMNFIHTVESDKRITDVRGVGINKDQQTGALTLNLTMNYYYTGKVTDNTLDYKFNSGSYGKTNPFK
jgi:Tfp pilus assembly protein PilO